MTHQILSVSLLIKANCIVFLKTLTPGDAFLCLSQIAAKLSATKKSGAATVIFLTYGTAFLSTPYHLGLYPPDQPFRRRAECAGSDCQPSGCAKGLHVCTAHDCEERGVAF